MPISPYMQEDGGGFATPPPPTAPTSTAFLSQYLAPPTSTPVDQGLAIYLGQAAAGGKIVPFGPDDVRLPTTTTDDVGYTNSMLGKFAEKGAEERRKWALWLAIAGFLPGGVTNLDNAQTQAENTLYREVDQGYANLLTEAAILYSQGIKITPEELLKREIEFRLANAGIDWNGKLNSLSGDKLDAMLEASGTVGDESQAKTWTSTTKSLDFMDPMDAKALARSVLQNELGRDPTEAEYQDFISAIHAAERHDPSVTRTTYTTNEDGQLVNQSSVTHQGIGADGMQQLATERARRNPGWAEWQAMGTYAPALYAALGATIPGV